MSDSNLVLPGHVVFAARNVLRLMPLVRMWAGYDPPWAASLNEKAHELAHAVELCAIQSCLQFYRAELERIVQSEHMAGAWSEKRAVDAVFLYSRLGAEVGAKCSGDSWDRAFAILREAFDTHIGDVNAVLSLRAKHVEVPLDVNILEVRRWTSQELEVARSTLGWIGGTEFSNCLSGDSGLEPPLEPGVLGSGLWPDGRPYWVSEAYTVGLTPAGIMGRWPDAPGVVHRFRGNDGALAISELEGQVWFAAPGENSDPNDGQLGAPTREIQAISKIMVPKGTAGARSGLFVDWQEKTLDGLGSWFIASFAGTWDSEYHWREFARNGSGYVLSYDFSHLMVAATSHNQIYQGAVAELPRFGAVQYARELPGGLDGHDPLMSKLSEFVEDEELRVGIFGVEDIGIGVQVAGCWIELTLGWKCSLNGDVVGRIRELQSAYKAVYKCERVDGRLIRKRIRV